MKRVIAPLVLAVAFVFPLKSQLKLNEFMSSNCSVIADEDGEYSDWVEIYNTSDAAVNLQNYSLTDDNTMPAKWQFPSYSLPAKSFVTVFASGKDRKELPYTWKTIINQGDAWKYFKPTSEMGTNWRLPSYSDSGWLQGTSGFGYGDSDDATVITSGISVFIRKTFTIDDLSSIKRLMLHMDYDDGFVAYINGVEVARNNLGTAGTNTPYNTVASDKEANIYRGLLPEQFEIANPASILVQGTNAIAIQVHNSSANSSDLTAIPFLTIATTVADASATVHPYFTAPKNYFHTNFKLSETGENLMLVSPAGVTVDAFTPMALNADISYGRQPDGTATCFFFAQPSFNASNNAQTGSSSTYADSVVFSSQSGYYPSGVTVSLSSPVAADKIYYTTDGSAPTLTSTIYSTPVKLTADGMIKARIYRTGYLPGPITGNTYIVTRKHKFPITSITTNPANLWDYNTGIYVKGPNANSAEPYYGANFWQDWERPAYFEVFGADGTKIISQGAGIKIHGAYTRSANLKSMAVFARKQYGKGSFSHKFFEDKGYDKFEALVFSNSGNDLNRTQFRDGFVSGLARNIDLERSAFKPSAHYLNGQYYGILNIREKLNEHYLASNQKFDTEDLTILASAPTVDLELVMGTMDDYKSLLSFVSNNNLQTSANYQKVLDQMEVDNYAAYQMFEIYVNNTDWPGNNIKFWRTHSPESKWRWILYDTDFGFGLSGSYASNTLEFATDATKTAWPNPAWSTLLFRRLLTSTQFRNRFITIYCDHLNTTFLPERINPQIDSMKTLFDGEIQYHIAKWGGSYSNWTSQVEVLRNYSNGRPAYAWSHLQSFFGLGEKLPVQLTTSNNSHGQIKLNTVMVDQADFTGYYFTNIPITLKALPKPGYKFVRWEGSVPSTSPEITFNMATGGTFNAVFTAAETQEVKVVINEINYKSATTFDTGDWVELYNNGAATVDLAGWQLTDLGKDAGYVFPAGTILYPGDYLVICDKLASFRNQHPSTRNSRGNFIFGLSSSGDKVRLYDATGTLMDDADFKTVSPWPTIENETGGTLELTNPNADNATGANWAIGSSYGTPGRKNASYVPTGTADKPGTTPFAMSCFPNPFRDNTTVEIAIPETNNYLVEVTDINGRPIKQLANNTFTPETYYFDWDGTDSNNKTLVQGVYFIRCVSAHHHQTIKVLKIN